MFGDLDLSAIAEDQPAKKIRRKPDNGLPTTAVAFATHTDRHQARRAKSLEDLLQKLPPRLVPGEVWHVLSSGDIDALTYLDYVLSWQSLDHLLISTWVMAETDVARLGELHAAGQIGRLDCYVGEVFPTSRIAEWTGLSQLCPATGGRLVVSRNHAKVMAGLHTASGFAVVIESSANVNTNPRAEQTTLTVDRSLYDFYADAFARFRNCWSAPEAS